MELALFLIAILALWLFIRIDQRKLGEKSDKPLDRINFLHGYIPGLAESWLRSTGCSLFCAISAMSYYFKPLAPPFTGKWSPVRQLLYSVVGPYGAALAFTAGAVIFAFAAAVKYQQVADQQDKQNAA